MKLTYSILFLSLTLIANEGDWDSSLSNWEDSSQINEEMNVQFEKAKIENRANRVYTDRVYKYITGDYRVENNTIEMATVRLNDNLQNEDVEVNIYSENLNVEGNSYRDGLDIRRNRYKNFVHNDENRLQDIESNMNQESAFSDYNGAEAYDEPSEMEGDNVLSPIRYENSRYEKVIDEDISEIEEIDLRRKYDIKEVNVLIENVNVLVD